MNENVYVDRRRPQLMMYVNGEFVWIPASRVPDALNFIAVSNYTSLSLSQLPVFLAYYGTMPRGNPPGRTRTITHCEMQARSQPIFEGGS